ncbi:TPA: hypothetical protein ACRRW5_005499, partial [Klebsiella quasipneumoniae]
PNDTSVGEISLKTGNNARNGGKNSLNRLIRCVCGKKIGPDPRNFNQRVSFGRNDLLIRTFPFTSSYDFNVLFANGVKVDIEELVIMADVLNDFDMAKKPKLPSADGLSKKKYNSNKQSQLIKALIRIHYSEADSNNPRSLLEDGGEILNDMTKLNIRPPVTGKTLKSWLDDVDIDYLEISR